jgi:hypothetical protein
MNWLSRNETLLKSGLVYAPERRAPVTPSARVRLIAAAAALMCASAGAQADDRGEWCFPVYRAGDAKPGHPECKSRAASAPTDLGHFTCTADTELINRYCGGECDVEPLQPVTDPDAIPFETGDPIREDMLSTDMQTNLACLRTAVTGANGTLTVTSAWRPQSYQDHLRELVVKHPKLIQLALMEDVEECLPAPYYLAVHPDFVRHGLNRNAARTSAHTAGQAFDANWSTSVNSTIDGFAAQCGLYRLLLQSASRGGDPIHFTVKPKKQDMNTWLAAPVMAAAAVGPAVALTTPEALGLTITVDGVHELGDDGTKVARYTYTVENISAPQFRGMTVGRDSFDAKSQPLLNDKGFAIDSEWVEAPAGWAGDVQQLEGSTKKMVQWQPANPLDMNVGVFPGQKATFSLRTHLAFPSMLQTKVLLGLKTFKYIDPVVVALQPQDRVAPTVSTDIRTDPAPDRPGWLKVTASHRASDDHDPYPEVLLSKIDSNQSISDKDVDAAFGSEATVFYVKQANGRNYTVVYKAMDASGNAANSKSTFDASKK